MSAEKIGNCNKTVFVFIILFSSILCHAQLRIIPNFGVIITRSKTISADDNVGIYTNLPALYYGLELNKKIKNTQISLGLHHAAVGAGSTYTTDKGYKSGRGLTTTQLQYSATVYQKVAEAKWFRRYYNHKTGILYTASHPNTKFYTFLFDVYPFLSYNLNQIIINKFPRGVQKDNYLYFSNNEGGSRLYTQNLIANTFGHSLSTGIKLQFKNKGKDVLGCSMMYNFGFSNLFATRFEHKSENSTTYDKVGLYFSKGSYWGLVFSYPIQLSHKKHF